MKPTMELKRCWFLPPTITAFLIPFVAYQTLYNFFILKLLVLITIVNVPFIGLTKLLRKEINLRWDEFLGINIIINSTMLLFLFVYFASSYSIPNKTIFILLVLMLSLIVSYLDHRCYDTKNAVDDYNIAQIGINYVFILYSIIVGSYLIFRSIPETYWYGNDPWEAVDVIREISRQLFSPVEAFNYFRAFIHLGNSGFYYFISFLHFVTDISIDNMIRIGPIIFGGMCSYLVYLVLRRRESFVTGLCASSILFVNPRINERFSMLLRENMAVLIFLGLMLVLIIKDEEKHDFSFGSLFIIGLFLSSITITHPTPTIFALFIIFFYIIKNMVNKNILNVKYLFACIIISIVIIWPYYSIIYSSFYWFFYSNNWTVPMIIFSIIMGMSFIFLYKSYYNNNKLLDILSDKYFRLFLTIVTLSIFVHTLLVPRNFSVLSLCNNLYPHMFSKTVNMLAIIGFISGLFLPLDTILYSFLGFLSILFFVTNLGFQVPLERLVIYITLFQTWCAAICLDRIYNFLKKYDSNKIDGDIRDLVGVKLPEYKVLGVIILLLFPSFVGEIWAITPPRNNSYTVDDVASLDCFMSTLQEGDVILPHKKVEWLLYYLDVSRDYVAVTKDEREWVESTYKSTSVNDSLKNIPEKWRDVKRVHVVSLTNYYYDYKDRLPFSSILENTVKKQFIGSAVIFTYEIPFKRSSLSLRGIKNIEDRGSDPIFECGSSGSWDEYVNSPSNIENIEGSSFVLFYTGMDAAGARSIGYATSVDGKVWTKNSDAVIEGSENPYLVVEDGVLYLYCESGPSYDIVRYETRDLVNWSKVQLSFNVSHGSKYRIQESPIVWIEGDAWKMLFTETVFSESDYYCGLRYAESWDGVNWDIFKEKGDWQYFNDFKVSENVVKLLVDGVNMLEEGYLFTGKFYVSNKPGHMDVITGSFWVYDLDSWSADFTPFNYTNIYPEEGAIDSVLIWRNPLSNQILIYYLDDGMSQDYSVTGSIQMGVPCIH